MPEEELSVLFPCPACAAPVCQRAYTINLAFGHDEDQYCLSCLASHYERDIEDLLTLGKHYVDSRECFRKAWDKQSQPQSCPLPEKCAFSICFGCN